MALEMVARAVDPMRNMFYLVGPKEMAESFETGHVPSYFVKAIPYFFLMMGVELVTSLAKGRKVFRINDTIVSILQGSFKLLWDYWSKLAFITFYCFVYEHYRIVETAPESWVGWIGCLCLVDLGYYWMHRYAHTFHVLWSAHSVHHSGEDYQLSTALRQGAMQSFFNWVFQIHNALFFHPLIYAHHAALNTLYQFWIHTTFVGHIGPFEYILNTASHHRMHHRPPGNCNYGGVLIIFDRIFGTFIPEDEQKDYYGLAKQYETFDPIWANVEHLYRMQSNVDPSKPRNFWYYINLLFKRRVTHKWVFTPLAVFEPFPERKRSLWAEPLSQRREKYDGLPSARRPAMQLYVVWLFIAAAVMTVATLLCESLLSSLEMAVVQFVCFFSFVATGRLCDGFEKGNRINTTRVLFYICLSSCLVTLSIDDETKALASKLFQGFAFVDAVFWFGVFSSLRSQISSQTNVDELKPKTN